MKNILAQDAMLTYPEFDKPFVIYTDASERQIGGVIMQNEKPLGFFSKKLNEMQKKDPVTEQELLAITEPLKYCKHMLLGHAIIIKTDHKNLTHPNLMHTSDRVLRQRLLLEEYGVELEYIKGEKNVIADALSRLPTAELFVLDADEEFPYVHSSHETIYVPAYLHSTVVSYYTAASWNQMYASHTKREFYWPRVDSAVEALVKTCNTCQKW